MTEEKKYILVTGGAGYIGSHTIVALIEKGYHPIIVDDFRNAHEDVITRLQTITQQPIVYHKISCHQEAVLDKLFKHYNFWGVIHFAADKAVGESVANPVKYFDNNLGGLISLIKVMQNNQVHRLVFSSSCTVYGEPKQIPVTEESPLSYSSPYGFTKLVNEQMLEQTYAAHPEFNTILLRYFNPIGAHKTGLIGEEPQGVPTNLLPYLTQTAVGKREQLIVHGDDYDTTDGTCIRDYIHVVDLAEAHVAALDYMQTKNDSIYEVINIGTGKGTSVKEMITCFESACAKKLNWTIGPRRPGDVPEIFAEVKKAQELLNWQARLTVEDAIKSAWKYEQNRLNQSNHEN